MPDHTKMPIKKEFLFFNSNAVINNNYLNLRHKSTPINLYCQQTSSNNNNNPTKKTKTKNLILIKQQSKFKSVRLSF